ncbi:hypothetical protein BG004_004500 [Podila humilis]|nr:hypothetical protein BG004_004500 [Podila humilis]
MRSSLGSQISFQLTNENLPFEADQSSDNSNVLQSVSTNTAAAAEARSLTASGHQFNQLFNHVNLIDEVAVAAGETEYVILGFLPDPRIKSRRAIWDSTLSAIELTNPASGNGSAYGDGVQIYDDSRQRDPSANGLSAIEGDDFEDDGQQTDSFDSFEVNGLVFFFAYKSTSTTTIGTRIHSQDKPDTTATPPSNKAPVTDQTLTPSPLAIHHEDLILATTDNTHAIGAVLHHNDPSTELTSHESSIGSMSGMTLSAPTQHKADYQHTVKFRSTVCRSVLYSNIGETGINFEDCIANQTYVKDFTIWNRSEIPLYWQLHTVDIGNGNREEWLKFVDYEDSFGDDVDDNVDYIDDQGQVHISKTLKTKPIPSYGYRRIRVIFSPRENGDFLFDLLLENLNDATNMEEATIHADVRAVSRGQDTLLISAGNTLDFGDCCAGMWTRLPLTFRNTGPLPTEIHLKVEGAEVVFDIQIEPGAVVTGEEQTPPQEDRFSCDPDALSGWHDSSRRSELSTNTDVALDQSPGGAATRSRLRDWVENSQSPIIPPPYGTSVPSIIDSAGIKSRLFHDQGGAGDSGPSSPVTSEGFSPDNILQINSNVEKYLAGQELGRSGKEGAAEDDLESEPDNTSQQESSSNAGMSISHKKRLSLRSISFSGAQREKEMAQTQNQPRSPVKGNQSTTRIEELFVKPGKERTVIVSYRPTRDASVENFQAGKLLKKSFRIVVSYAPWGGLASSISFSENPQKDRKIVQCKARACTSFVTFEPKSIDFGDTDVGHYKSLPIKLVNQSELPAIVQLDFQSKVLNCTPSGAITIPSKSSTELKLEIYPRKVNPDYRKQLTLFNLTNRSNDQIIEVRSTNIDKNRVTFHSLFYRVLYPGGSNFLDFGTVFVGGLSLRMLTISNFTKNWLTLEVTTSLNGELSIYERAREHQTYLNLTKVSGLVETTPVPLPISAKALALISDSSKTVSRTCSPPFGENSTPLDSSRSGMAARRQEQRDQLSTTASDSGTPVAMTGSSLTSSLALKAKAILFHGDTHQTVGSTPAKFLDLATNRLRESKKVMRRIPTMKELLEPTSRSITLTAAERPGKGQVAGQDLSLRSPRSQAHGPNVTGVMVADTFPKRSETGIATANRLADQRAAQSESVCTSTEPHPQESLACLSEQPLDVVLSALDANSATGKTMLFYKPADEERFVKDKMKLTRELQNAIGSGELVPVSVVSVPPETEHQLFILFTPSSIFRDHIKGIPKKQDARIFLRLVDFDQGIVANNPQFQALLDGDVNLIPLREIMVRSSLVRSIMDLGQNNINFGTMDKGEKRTKTIIIHNRSKEPLLYHIRKSGSIASGDIVLGVGKSGVVRGYSKKEVDFIFEPSLSGPYYEKLAIENIQDPDSSRVLHVKAYIRKPKHFSIDSQEIDFGTCAVGEKSECQRITITNSTKQTRTFEVRVDPHELMPLVAECQCGGEIDFTMEDDPAGMAVVTKEMEDEIEILEQKLKIAKRKGRADKVLKVTARLSLLRKGGIEELETVGIKTDMDDATPTQEKILEFNKPEQAGSRINDLSGNPAVANTLLITPATPTIKDQSKFKRTEHSIVFTLEAGKTKSVSAYFTPIYDSDGAINGSPLDKDRVRVQGKIYVHEHKNRDICRDVTFYAIVEPGPVSSKESMGTASESSPTSVTHLSQILTKYSSKEESAPSNVVDVRGTEEITSKLSMSSILGVQPAATEERLSLAPTVLEAGKLEQGQKSNYYFKLSNSSKSKLPYRIELTHGVEHRNRILMENNVLKGTLEPLETRKISFGFLAQDLGYICDSLHVVDLTTHNATQFKFSCFTYRSQYLAFPSLDESMELDLGHCYVDTGRKYSQVTPLLVENITDDDVYIACASNLSQQVGIYMDEQAQKGHVTKTLLKKRSMVTVWVAVQPNLLGGIAGTSSNRRVTGTNGGTGHTSGKDRDRDRDSECRTMVGGIKFVVSIPEDIVSGREMTKEITKEQPAAKVPLTPLTTQTVKFTSIIGRSILSVSDTLLNLGWTPDIGKPVYGSFTLQNMSSRLPLDFSVESLSGNIILDRTGGILDGWDVGASSSLSTTHCKNASNPDLVEGEQMDRSRMWISFRVTASTPGLFSDTILVTNENNCSQKIEIKVRLFVDQKRLLTTNHSPGYACPLTLDELKDIQDRKPGAPREALSLPTLTWSDVYVDVHEDQEAGEEISRHTVNIQPFVGETELHIAHRWMELTNEGDEVLELAPLCDIQVDTHWEPSTADALGLLPSENTEPLSGLHLCGQVVQLLPRAKVRLLVSCPKPNFGSDDVDLLLSGKSVTLTGNLMLLNQIKNQIIKAFVLSSTFGVSYGEVVPILVDVGKIGHYNSWSPVRAKFDVKNTSDIPLLYEILLENYMELEDVHAKTEKTGSFMSTKRRVNPRSLDSVELSLDPRKIKDYEIGRRTFPIHVVNLQNPENDTVVEIVATLTEFELDFDRLTDGMLVLPPLTHPLPSSALPCDAWFSITNKSPEDVRFEIGATLSSDVVEYVHLDVLSRFSNSPLRGNISLSSRGSIEVRVRAFPKEGSRLPSDTSTLCSPDGLIFGSLWVMTKAQSTEDDPFAAKRFGADIPIRGALVEGLMYSLSTQRIVFKSLLQTSDYEDESGDEQLSAPDSLQYSSTRDASDDGMDSNVQMATITLSNLSTSFPLDFQATLEGPMEYPAAEIVKVIPLDMNNCGRVEAGQQLKLVVELIDPHVIISEDIKLFIRNVHSNLGQQQRVLISIISDTREHRKPTKKPAIEDERIDPHHHQNKLEESRAMGMIGTAGVSRPSAIHDDTSDLQPVISLRGCKRIDSSDSLGGRFELDLGQQDMGSANVLRKLVLENLGYDRVSYRIKTISAMDKNWIKISRLDGTLDSSSDNESQSSGSSTVNTISLSFSTNVRNVFSTYLLIENVDNPVDTKTVRITMEVVARQNLRRITGKGNDANTRVFDVFVNGIDNKNSLSIDMKNLYYGSEYTARSMVVFNRESVPMEFTFKSNLSPSDSTEILFSTSRTSAKLFKTLTVPSENHVRVYIRFFPRPSAAIQAALDNGEYRDPDEMELKTVEIYINCRLVKDYQQVVLLKAECYLPAVRIDWQDSASFVGHLQRTAPGGSEGEEWKISFKEEYRLLGVTNLLDIPLNYEIVNDTMYFNLEYPEPDRMIERQQRHLIRIVPNVKALLRNADNFRREKYVQENITIYNRNRPLENYWIPLRLSFGNVSNFQLSSGYKSSYAFGMIEQHVVNFLSNFNSHAVLVTMASCFSGTTAATGASIVGSGFGIGVGLGVGTGYGANSATIGLGSDRSVTNGVSNGASNGHTSVGSTGPLTLTLQPTSAGSVATMLGLGRAASIYHSPSHHPQYQSAEAQETQRKLIDLEFQYHYVVDQLVYYSTIKTGENFFQLAGLLFCTLLGNRIFQIWSPAYLRDPRLLASGSFAPLPSSSTIFGATSGNVGAPNSIGNGLVGPGSGSGPGSMIGGGGGSISGSHEEDTKDRVLQTGSNGFTMMNPSFHQQRNDGEEVIRVWPESLRKWVEALDYFVSFFPYHTRQLEALKTLHHSLISS